MKLLRTFLFALGCPFFVLSGQAQVLELTPGNFNSIYIAPAAAPTGSNQAALPATANSNFRGMGAVAGSNGPVSTSAVHGDRYPSNPANTIVFPRTTLGGIFGASPPLYFMGDEITPPLTNITGGDLVPGGTEEAKLTAARLYWRAQPVLPGENFPLAGGILIPLGSVRVIQADVSSTTVTVSLSPSPSGLVEGATLLGQPIAKISGATVTLAGKPNETITSSADRPITPAMPFYYSRHADKVFASQPGQVDIRWVRTGLNGVKTESFVVSGSTRRPVRKIYWTEGSFDGPKVQITDSRISSINPVFYRAVPKAVAEEVNIPGYLPLTPNLTTLSFDKFNGTGQLHAYNVEGRILIEYLGNVRLGDIYESLGTDVVELQRAPDVYQVEQNLGTQMVPRLPAVDGDELLLASPVQSTAVGTASYYGTSVRADGSLIYHAERETSAANNPDNGEPVSSNAYNRVVFYWLEESPDNFGIKWPKFQTRYWQRWSPNLADYAHYTVDATGSTAATGVPFPGGSLPTIVWQDDPAQAEAKLDLAAQRLFVTFAPTNPVQRNRSLLKFTDSRDVWYVNLYTQGEGRMAARTVDANGTNTVTLTGGGTTVGLEAGMVVTGTGITGAATIVSITDNTHFVISQNVSTDTTYAFTVESDAAAPVNTTALVGTRIPPPAGHEIGGYISEGRAYFPEGYLNPFTYGVATASLGAIIPVNARTGENRLTVRWFKKVSAPGPGFHDFFVPGKIGRYTLSYPATTTPQIVIAEGVGTGDLAPEVAVGAIYYQNNPALPGYNPNEEHALIVGTRAYAVRDDLNMIAPQQSEPFVLIGYTNAADQRPDMKIYRVVREVDADGDRADPFDILFDRPAVAGNLLMAPYPLPLMPLPFDTEGVCQNVEVTPPAGLDPRINTAGTPVAWDSFTKKDRKGFHWIYRGPHDGVSTAKRIAMQYKYVSRLGFFLPGAGGGGSEIAPGTLLPFLRPLEGSVPQGDPVTGTPLTINFIPQWPENAPELRVGETLALPKFGLPQVLGQKSTEVFYEQSRALATAKPSVILHDFTREKTIQLAEKNLDRLPESIATTNHMGKLYFQLLPPDLQERIWFDPLRAPNREIRPGTLVLVGQFKDEIAGEDYLHLNVFTAAQIAALKALCTEPGEVKANWDSAIEALNTQVETFIENPQRRGTYIADPAQTVSVGEDELTKVTDPDTSVASYAVTATGEAAGWVTMIFGNGKAFTPDGDPVQVKVFKVAPMLYTGELKTLYSRNPLDEKVTLRHTGDFAARPQDYEFEWRWAPGSATAPAIYTTSWAQRFGAGTNNQWAVVRNPANALPTAAEYTAAGAALPFPRSIAIRDAAYSTTAGNPGLVLRNTAILNFAGGGVPGDIVFSASMGALDGFVLYINGNPALANLVPAGFENTDAVSGLVPGNLLQRQFRVPRSFFTAGTNDLEIAVFTGADANAPSFLDFRLDVTQEVDVTASTFQPVNDPGPDQKNTNVAIVGGDPSLPFGGSTFVLNDRWFTMRYRPKPGVTNVAGTGYSRWMPPQFV
jgi:hypothetical protein